MSDHSATISADTTDYDVDLTVIFSFWDRLFGTDAPLITDTNGLMLGLSPDEERRYDGVIKLHMAPFLGLYHLAKKNLAAILKSRARQMTNPCLFPDHPLSVLIPTSSIHFTCSDE